MTKADINSNIDYLFKKINWGSSFLDAKAIQIMNELKSDIAKLETLPEVAEDEVLLTIPFKKVWIKKEDGGYSGALSFRIHDCIASITTGEGKDKKVVGEIGGTIGAGYELEVKDDPEKEFHLRVDPKTIWNAYCSAIGKDEMKMD